MFLTNKYITCLLLFIQALSARPTPTQTCTLTCNSNCITCVEIDDTNLVTLDVSACKNDPLSWMACGECTAMESCDGSPEGIKCNEVLRASYYVSPASLESGFITVQVHDGKIAGNVDCDDEHEVCYGGSGTSCGTISGVCNFDIPLSSCPPAQPVEAPAPSPSGGDFYGDEQSIPCSSDSDCLSLPCGQGKCLEGSCTIVVLPEGTVCREAVDLCDEAEVCNGFTPFCPFEDAKKSGTICRYAVDLCDADDVCDGINDACFDQKQPAGTVCRPTQYGTDGTTCDVPETCSGVDNECPSDAFSPQGTVCRDTQDLCDVADTCSGDSVACPSDLRNDHAITMKCANTCYLCGASPSELTTNRGGSSMLGGCTIGKCREFVVLPWPECEHTCANAVCDNNRGLSNIAHYSCDKNNGQWRCMDKTDIIPGTDFPLCPLWVLSG